MIPLAMIATTLITGKEHGIGLLGEKRFSKRMGETAPYTGYSTTVIVPFMVVWIISE